MWASFTRQERSVLLGLIGLFMVGGVGKAVINTYSVPQVFQAGALPPSSNSHVSGLSARPTTTGNQALESVNTDGRIDLNSAPADVLEQLPGVGPSKAAEIIAYRNQHGGFRSPDELDNVSGFGPASMNRLRDRIMVTSAPASVSHVTPTPGPAIALRAQPVRSAPRSTGISQSTLININTASAQELATLHRIGETIAQRIVEDRARNGPFPTVEALDRVKGVGPAILQANRHRMTVR